MSDSDPVLVAGASNPAEAQIWVDMLRDEGILATTVDRSVRGALGGVAFVPPRVYVMVNRADIVRARNVIAESGGASALEPIPAAGTDSRDRAVRAILMAGGAAIAFMLIFAIFNAIGG